MMLLPSTLSIVLPLFTTNGLVQGFTTLSPIRPSLQQTTTRWNASPPQFYKQLDTKRMKSTTVGSLSSSSTVVQSESSSSESSATTKVVAKGTVVTSISSPSSTVLAVELRDEEIIQTTTTASEQPKTTTSKPQQSGIQGEDFTGKKVIVESSDDNERSGIVIAQRPPMIFVFCDFPVKHETEVSVLSTKSSISSAIVLDSKDDNNKNTILYWDSLSTNNDNDNNNHHQVFSSIPQVKDIDLINEPLLTGTTMIDALSPIGKGQNMLLIGSSVKDIGQRDLVFNTIRSQISSGANCVYALASSSKEEVIQKCKDLGLLESLMVVSTRSNHDDDTTIVAAAEAIVVAAMACTIAETMAKTNGDDTLVIIDDVDSHKVLWDWTTRVLVDKYGYDAVVKNEMGGSSSSEMRSFYSNLIQRAAKFNLSNGGGSMTLAILTNLPSLDAVEENDERVFTAKDFQECSDKVQQRIDILVQKNIPLTVANLNKIQIPAPIFDQSETKRRMALQHVDDLISMSDGQIWFDEGLYYEKGQRPAMDPQRSITRVGVGADTNSRADAPAMRRLVGGLRFEFAQAASSSLEGADGIENSGMEKQILQKNSYLLAMHQDSNDGVRTLSENAVVLLAASIGSFQKTIQQGGVAGTETGKQVIQGLLTHVWKVVPAIMREIDNTLDLNPSALESLESVINDYMADV